ncbi:MAG: hypothetical protein PHZ00_04020 [Candidatus Peribacteraceae bacterium]|nr:hypothetical protein [Candidatus Peribacteraceae bacterium]
MSDLHLHILRKPQRTLWDAFQRDASVIQTQGFYLAGGTALALFGASFNPMLPLRAMVHFTDLDEEIPVILDASLKDGWQEILRKAVREVTA